MAPRTRPQGGSNPRPQGYERHPLTTELGSSTQPALLGTNACAFQKPVQSLCKADFRVITYCDHNRPSKSHLGRLPSLAHFFEPSCALPSDQCNGAVTWRQKPNGGSGKVALNKSTCRSGRTCESRNRCDPKKSAISIRPRNYFVQMLQQSGSLDDSEGIRTHRVA